MDAVLAPFTRQSLPTPPPDTAPLPFTGSEARWDDATLTEHTVQLAGLAVFGNLRTVAPDLLEGMRPTLSLPDRVTAQDVADLTRITDLMERWDFLYGGALSLTAVLGQLEHVRMIYQTSSCTPQVRTLLQSALARTAKVAAWMAVDAGDLAVARRCWLLGLSMATDADDALVKISLLTDMARAAIHTGRAQDALSLMALAGASAGAATQTVRTAMAAVTARAHGALGQRDDCRSQIDTAYAHFSRRDPEEDPAWMAFYDAAQLAGDAGHALFPLALHGHDHDQTIALLTQAIRTHTHDAARSVALSRGKVVRLHLFTGNLEAASSETAPLLEAAITIRSARIRQDLSDLSTATEQFGADPTAAQLRQRISTVVRSAL
ncbi:hypothetical protein [Nocardiopsis dassonvillei]|uniref:hypothetical protein n=1 Tax=Nocardiopsis dassonvillei TaxID=2014 RepID=UPI0033C31DA7